MTDLQQRAASTRPTPPLSLPHRHHPSRSLPRTQDAALPWEQMSNAYAWVAGQEDAMKGKKRSFKTEDWVREQQQLLQTPKAPAARAERARASKIRRHEWEEIVYVYGVEAEQWMKEEARARRVAEERERAKLRIQDEVRRMEPPFLARRQEEREQAKLRIQEEVRRMEPRFLARREEERERAKLRIQEEVRRMEPRFLARREEERERAKLRIQDEVQRMELRFLARREEEMRAREDGRRRAAEERREKEARDRAKLDRLIVDAWAGYEARWAALASSAEPLGFKSTPWPLIIQPRNAGDLTRDAIVAFLFSPLHSEGMSRKDRIRSAQLRWHPDRFRRFDGRISAEEKGAVEEGVGIVARCLNELMEREKRRKL